MPANAVSRRQLHHATGHDPTESLQAPLRTSLVQLAIVGAAALAASGLLALLFSWGITTATRGLAERARALGASEEVEPLISNLAEFTLISDALVSAGTAIAERLRERKRSEAQRDLLVKELNHRVKNSLAVAQSIATQTLRSSLSLPEARSALSARLISSGALMTRENWEGADVADIVANAIDLYGARSHFTEGPPTRLVPGPSLSISLVLHELMTNATKYGALSSNEGTVSIRWWNIVEPDKPPRLL